MNLRTKLAGLLLVGCLAGCGGIKGNIGTSDGLSLPKYDNSISIRKVNRKGMEVNHEYRYGLLNHPLSKNLKWGHLTEDKITGKVLSRQDLIRVMRGDNLYRTIFDYDSETGEYLGRVEIEGVRGRKGYQCNSKYYGPSGIFVREELGVPKGFSYHFVSHVPEKVQKKIEKTKRKLGRGIALP